MGYDEDILLRTSAAAAAALRASPPEEDSPPNVRGGPPTFGFACFGTEAFALLEGAGAEPKTRPGPSKLSLDCLPQQDPIVKLW